MISQPTNGLTARSMSNMSNNKKDKDNEPNPNRESQQEYFGLCNDRAQLEAQRQLSSLAQLNDRCYICRQKEEDLKKQLASQSVDLKKSNLQALELQLEVAQLKLALAKAEK